MEGHRGTVARRLRRRIERWRRVTGEVLRREGPIRLLVRIAAVARTAVYGHVVVVGLDLMRPLPPIARDLAVEVRLLRKEDLDAYARFRRRPVGVVPVVRRLERGDLCVAAWLDGEIVSAAWVAFESAHVDEIRRALTLAPDEAYVYDSYTTEGYRRRGVAALRSRWSAEHLRGRGYRRCVGWISPHNRPAFGPVRKLGYETLGIAGYVRLGPLRRDFVRPTGGPRRWATRNEPIVVARDFDLARDGGSRLEAATEQPPA